MAHSSAHAGGLLPRGVAIAWIAALVVVIVAHCRPLIATRGRARVWHALHLAMAATMVLMYLSASVVSIGVSGTVWTIAFAASAALWATPAGGRLVVSRIRGGKVVKLDRVWERCKNLRPKPHKTYRIRTVSLARGCALILDAAYLQADR